MEFTFAGRSGVYSLARWPLASLPLLFLAPALGGKFGPRSISSTLFCAPRGGRPHVATLFPGSPAPRPCCAAARGDICSTGACCSATSRLPFLLHTTAPPMPTSSNVQFARTRASTSTTLNTSPRTSTVQTTARSFGSDRRKGKATLS